MLHMVWITALAVLGAPAPTDADAPDDEAILIAMATLVDEWQQRVAFKCHFRRRLARSASLDDAFAGRGDTFNEDAAPSGAVGWFYKLGSKVRYGVDYQAPPKELGDTKTLGLPSAAAVKAVINVSYDEVSNGRLEAWFHPRRGQYGDAAWVAVRPENRKGAAIAGPVSNGCISPLTPLNSGVPNVLRLMAPGSAESAAPDHVSVKALADERIELSFDKSYLAPPTEIARRVVMWTRPSPPVVERIYDDTKLSDGRRLRYHVLLGEFQDCPGGMVPRLVRKIIPSVGDDGMHDCILEEWRSSDLGVERPTDKDFVLALGPETRIIGFAKPMSRGEVRRLDLDRLRIEDLDLSDGLPKRTAIRSVMPRTNYTLIGLLNVALLGAVTAYWCFHARKTGRVKK